MNKDHLSRDSACVCKPYGTSRITLVITGFCHQRPETENEILWTETHRSARAICCDGTEQSHGWAGGTQTCESLLETHPGFVFSLNYLRESWKRHLAMPLKDLLWLRGWQSQDKCLFIFIAESWMAMRPGKGPGTWLSLDDEEIGALRKRTPARRQDTVLHVLALWSLERERRHIFTCEIMTDF